MIVRGISAGKRTKKPLSIMVSIISAGLAGAFLPHVVHADKKSEPIEEVLVTGSNIKRSGLETPTPLTLINNEDLKISSNTSIADTIFELPSAGIPGASQSTSNFQVFASGLSSVDLRNLGTVRTLVLVNGRRHVGGDSENPNVVDLNSIPAEFIDSIEIITGGASAVYGSEAMAGVINLKTKKNYNGLTIDLQTGVSAEGDGEDSSISITGGRSFDDGRGQALFHFGYTELKEIASRDRSFSDSDEFLGDFEAFSSFPPQGGIFSNDGYTTIADDGTWTKPFVGAEDGFNRANSRLLQIPLERKDINFNIDYELAKNLNLFVESSVTQTSSHSNLEPTIIGQFITVGSQDLTIPSSNPFIPQEILDTWTDAGDPIPENLTWRKRFTELGPRFAEQERDTLRLAFGLEGSFASWSWDAYYQWGQTTRNQTTTGNFNTLYFQQGLDAEADPDNPGAFRCREATARALGCVPIDVFGVGSISQQAVDYVAVDSQDKSVIQQQVAAAKISGDLFNLTSAGAVKLAAGVEYRKEQLDTVVDALAASGLSSSNASAPVSGSYDVSEVFVEVAVPLLAEMPAAAYLGVDAAYRIADYSTLGNHGSWKLGMEWAPISDLRFRATVAESVRAPNVAELFDPGGETFESFIDPCINGGASGEGNTQQNCASLGIPNDFNPGPSGGSAGGIQAGNINLKEETANTTTIGFVYRPSWLENASFTMDYFDIEIEDAIELIDPQVKLDQCYGAVDFPNNVFCDGIRRDGADLGFLVKRLDFGLENIGLLTTSGYDFEFNYGFSALGGDFSLRTLITKTNEWEREILGIQVSDYEEPGFQEWKGSNRLTYATGPLSVSWSTRYIGSGVVDNEFTTEDWPDNENLDAEWYQDINARYTIETESVGSYAIYGGVNNLTDNDPPYIPTPSENADTGTGTASGVYDVVGRFYYVGVELSF